MKSIFDIANDIRTWFDATLTISGWFDDEYVDSGVQSVTGTGSLVSQSATLSGTGTVTGVAVRVGPQMVGGGPGGWHRLQGGDARQVDPRGTRYCDEHEVKCDEEELEEMATMYSMYRKAA